MDELLTEGAQAAASPSAVARPVSYTHLLIAFAVPKKGDQKIRIYAASKSPNNYEKFVIFYSFLFLESPLTACYTQDIRSQWITVV